MPYGMQLFWECLALQMMALCFFETLVTFYQFHVPNDFNLHPYCSDNLKSFNLLGVGMH